MKPWPGQSRRRFLKTGIAAGTSSLLALQPAMLADSTVADIRDHYRIVFQGDSITDGNRTRNNDWNHIMGHGYAYIIAAKLWYDYPEKQLQIYNRGISGNKITDLSARWDADSLALQPDLLSILIGINDCSAAINGNKECTVQRFEEIYRALLLASRKSNPALQLVLCEPFILPVGQVVPKYSQYQQELAQRQAVLQKLATEMDAIYIPYQQIFNDALHRAPADYWIWDGIHPMPAGHELMALEWRHRVAKKIGLKKPSY